MKDAFAIAASRPWLIQGEALEAILAIAQRQGSLDALQARAGERLEKTRSAWARNGVAVIPVTGPIFRYANLFTDISGATSTQVLARDFQAAMDNPLIRAVVLDIDSPGGEASGINELAKLISQARSRKKVVAYGGGAMASAAYWLGSSASEIVIDDTAVLGSIGVVMSWLDTRARDENSGVRRIEIVSSQSPDKRADPATEEGRAKVQAIVDRMAGVFVSAVARNRGTTPDRVISDFGRGGVLLGQAAVDAGMADRIGSLESVIAELAGSASNSKRTHSMSTANAGQVTVASTDDLRTALAAGYTADQITVAPAAPAGTDSANCLATARAEGVEEGRKAATEGAIKAERARIRELQALSRAGFGEELEAAIDAGDSPEKFALTLITAAKDRGITLDAMRKDAPPAQGHSAAPPDGQAPQSWDSIVAKFGG